MSTRVLLVDDDVELVALLRDYLAVAGYVVSVAHDGATALAAVHVHDYDMVVMDVMMPKKNGIETLAQIRRSCAVPVILLTARGDDADRITGLELGADDYVPKPCTPRELVARIRAILRRVRPPDTATASSADTIVVGTLTIWPAQRRASRNGEPLDLTSTEFGLLEALARHAGSPVSKSELSLTVLDRPLTAYDRSIDVHMSRIRTKLGPMADGHSRIQTVIRKGYQLITE